MFDCVRGSVHFILPKQYAPEGRGRGKAKPDMEDVCTGLQPNSTKFTILGLGYQSAVRTSFFTARDIVVVTFTTEGGQLYQVRYSNKSA